MPANGPLLIGLTLASIGLLLLLILVAPLIALIVQLAVSRSREYGADATGARNIRLATDLRKTLKQKTARRIIHPRDAHEIAEETRESFRQAINGKLVLPPSIARLAA